MSKDVTVKELKGAVRDLRMEINKAIEKFAEKHGENVVINDLEIDNVFVVGGREFPQFKVKWSLKD